VETTAAFRAAGPRRKPIALPGSPWALQVGDHLRSGSDDQYLKLEHVKAVARNWAGTVPGLRRAEFAALFARQALAAFAQVVSPAVLLSEPYGPVPARLDESGRQLATTFGRWASRLPILEALHHLTSLYTALLPASRRSQFGAFYTPPALARRLVELASDAGVDWRTARVLDPASGGAVLLLHAALRMREALAGSEAGFVLSQLGGRILGLELDPYAACLAQNAFEVLVADLTAASGLPAPRVIAVADALETTPTESFDLVIGNPPYGRVVLPPDQRRRYSRSLYGHANLYGVFTDIALRWVKPGGFIAYLTPASMLGGQYYSALRQLLALEAPPIAVDFVRARRDVFEDVLQETLLALYGKHAKPGRFQVHYLHFTDDRQAIAVRNGTVALPSRASDPWLAPRDPAQASLIAHVEGMPSRLADWGYEVSTGPLVWNRFKSQLTDQPGPNIFPLIWAEAVTSDGQFVFRAVKRSHAPYFKLGERDAWLRVNDPCVLVQRTTAKEQHRRLIAAALPKALIAEHGGVVVENHLNMVRPVGRPLVSPAALAATLNSPVVDQVFRCISGSVAVSAFELQAIPLPSPEQMKPVEALVKGRAPREKIEAAIAALYVADGG